MDFIIAIALIALVTYIYAKFANVRDAYKSRNIKKRNKIPRHSNYYSVESNYNDTFSDRLWSSDEYLNLNKQQPRPSDYFGRDLDYPKYTDRYKTDNGFKLRELLLLVWWGKASKGRSNSVNIPKYFFETYNLNGDKLTNAFISKGYLYDDGQKMHLTENGNELYNQYKNLWEIHAVKNFPTNLDIDFPNWNKQNFDIKYYNSHIAYLTAQVQHSDKVVDFFKKNPQYSDIGNQKEYHTSSIKSNLKQLRDFKEKLSILTEQVQKSYK